MHKAVKIFYKNLFKIFKIFTNCSKTIEESFLPINFSKLTLLQANVSFILESFHDKTSKKLKKWSPNFLFCFFTLLTDTYSNSWFYIPTLGGLYEISYFARTRTGYWKNWKTYFYLKNQILHILHCSNLVHAWFSMWVIHIWHQKCPKIYLNFF